MTQEENKKRRKINYKLMNTHMINKLATLLMAMLTATAAKAADVVKSPDGRLAVEVSLKGGQPTYSLTRGGKTVIGRSALGFRLSGGDLSGNFRLLRVTRAAKDETWQQPWGEERNVRNHYNEMKICLQEKGGQKRRLNIVFRVFDDGMGLRYEFPEQPALKKFEIMDELTTFNLPGDPDAWSQKTNGTVYYEGLYTREPLSRKDTVSTPVTIEAADSLYLSIHEADLTDYASLNLTPRKAGPDGVSLLTALTPWQSGVKVYAAAPSVTPWRTVVVASRPGDLITSRLILNLNAPSRLGDTSWIKPGRYIGIWWGMHMKKYTWEQGPHHGATTANTRRYIDFAARHGFSGVLVEGWNYGWDGDWTLHGDRFDFCKPYPDYDFADLQKYALSKGVSIIAHNETGGAAANYERQLEKAFTLYESMGIGCVKTGYVNPMLDGKELQHSQYGVRHYRKVLEAAARHRLMLVNHEPAMPSGLRRTYPNMMSAEGMRGQEYNAWSPDGGNPPSHICILPFTRGLAGPMDFTPGIFNFENEAMPGTRPQTTIAKQLAEYIVIYSPLQMAADMIENYEGHPALSFIETCPTDWEQTIVPCAEIGRHLTIARQQRGTGNWFIGSVTDGQQRDISLPLSFLEKGAAYTMTVYEDGPGADYATNPYALSVRTEKVSSDSVLKLRLARSGGAAVRIIKE